MCVTESCKSMKRNHGWITLLLLFILQLEKLFRKRLKLGDDSFLRFSFTYREAKSNIGFRDNSVRLRKQSSRSEPGRYNREKPFRVAKQFSFQFFNFYLHWIITQCDCSLRFVLQINFTFPGMKENNTLGCRPNEWKRGCVCTKITSLIVCVGKGNSRTCNQLEIYVVGN